MKKVNYLLTLVAFLVVFFTSCVEDTWTTGTLDYRLSTTTGTSGYFEGGDIFYSSDLKLNSYAEYINHFNSTRAILKITGDFYVGDVISGLELDVDGVGIYRFGNIQITPSDIGNYITIADSYSYDDSAFNNYMYNVFDYMSRYGKHDVMISGFLYDRNGVPISGTPIDFYFYNDLDVNVRD